MMFVFLLLLLVAATWLSATGMLFLKLGAERFRLHLPSIMKDWQIMLACALYGASFIIYVTVLREVPISVAYPLTSMNYIWAAILSKKFLKERIDAWRWTGIGLIMVGIILLAFGR